MKSYEERTSSIQNRAKRKQSRRNAFVSVAACVCVAVFVLCAVLIPQSPIVPNINAYKNSEYFAVIQKLYDYNYVFWKNEDNMTSDNGAEAAPDADAPTNAPFEETTLNQVEGVAEGDILKRTATHAFYLTKSQNNASYQLFSYELNKENSAQVGSFEIRAEENTSFLFPFIYNGFYHLYGNDAEMYVSDDGKTATVFVNCKNAQNIVYTCIVSLDISNPKNVCEKTRCYVAGEYKSSRKVNGQLLVVTNFRVEYSTDFNNLQTFVPSYGKTLDDVNFFAPEEIFLPQGELQNCAYTVVAKVSEEGLEVIARNSLLSYTQEVAVSQNHVFALRTLWYYTASEVEEGYGIQTVSQYRTKTEIVCLTYQDDLQTVGVATVPGTVKDRYSLDEHNGILRVATTLFLQNGRNAGLYCVDLSTMQIVAQKERFAPDGEWVHSARFDGDVAYVCTAISFSDPVFKFDLSNLSNITCIQTDEITGYSFSLIKFGEYLLGIGYENSLSSLKIELYQEQTGNEQADRLQSVALFQKQDCSVSTKYKAHFVDVEHGLVGLGLYDYADYSTANGKYLLLQLQPTQQDDGLQWTVFWCGDVGGTPDNMRAFYKDGGVYVLSDGEILFLPTDDANA
ncbi:MAG: beta-propeller domain-containing protein [Candidatus Fimimonas sp.]